MELASTLASEVAGIVIELRSEAESLTRVADFLEREIVIPFAEGASPEAEDAEPRSTATPSWRRSSGWTSRRTWSFCSA